VNYLTVAVEWCAKRRGHGNERHMLESSHTLPDTKIVFPGSHDWPHILFRYIISPMRRWMLNILRVSLGDIHREYDPARCLGKEQGIVNFYQMRLRCEMITYYISYLRTSLERKRKPPCRGYQLRVQPTWRSMRGSGVTSGAYLARHIAWSQPTSHFSSWLTRNNGSFADALVNSSW
jgi:hypothetical protein